MKKHTPVGIMAAVTLVAGCSTLHPRGPAYGHEQEFRKQLEASLPVQDKIEDIRFNYNFEKVLVIYEPPKIGRREAIFEDDGFGRYHGEVLGYEHNFNGTGQEGWPNKTIIITFPD